MFSKPVSWGREPRPFEQPAWNFQSCVPQWVPDAALLWQERQGAGKPSAARTAEFLGDLNRARKPPRARAVRRAVEQGKEKSPVLVEAASALQALQSIPRETW